MVLALAFQPLSPLAVSSVFAVGEDATEVIPAPAYHSPSDGALRSGNTRLVWRDAQPGVANNHEIRWATSIEGLESAEIIFTAGAVHYDLKTDVSQNIFWQVRALSINRSIKGEWSVPRSLRIDATKPVVKVNLGRSSYVDSGATISKISVPEVEAHDENLDRFEIWKDGKMVGNPALAEGAKQRRGNISHLVDGQYIVRAYDKVGNVSDDFVINMDSTAPTGELSYDPSTLTNKNVTVTLTTNEPIVQASLPGTWQKKSDTRYQKVFPANAAQEATLEDLAGNKSSITVSIDWIDKVAPTLSVNLNRKTEAKSGDVVTSASNPEILASDANLDKITVWRDGKHVTEWSADNATERRAKIGWLAEGTYILKAHDKAKNVSADFEITIDNTAPVVENVSVDELTNANTLSVNGKVFDTNLENYNIRVYKGDKSGQVAPGIAYTGTTNVDGELANLNISSLADGQYWVRIWADDLAGNRTGINSHIYVPFTVDRTAPTLSFTPNTPADNSAVRGKVLIGAVVDGEATAYHLSQDIPYKSLHYKYSPVNGDVIAYEWDTSVLADGVYTLKARAVDSAKNATEISRTFTVDNTAPIISISSPAKDADVSDVITVEGTAEDATSGVEKVAVHLRKLKENGKCDGFLTNITAKVANGKWSADIDTAGYANGAYCITVLASDLAGNSNGAGATLKTFNINNSTVVDTDTDTETPPVDQPGGGSTNPSDPVTVPTNPTQPTQQSTPTPISIPQTVTTPVTTFFGTNFSTLTGQDATAAQNEEEVLAEEDNRLESERGSVLNETDNAMESADKEDSFDFMKFLGDWWWLILLGVLTLGLLWWFIAWRRRKDEEDQ